jgi:hypothetical protein
MSIKIDLHVHSKVSKSIPFEMRYFDSTVERAKQVGLGGFALTEHLHSRDYWHSMRRLAERFDYRDGMLQVSPGFNVLTGAELTVGEVADVILIGSLEALQKFDNSFERRPSDGFHPPVDKIFGPAKLAGLFVIGAHAMRPGKRLCDVGKEQLSRFDALEINGKDVANGDHTAIPALADELGLPTVGSSDAHLWSQVGVQRTVAPISELTQDSVRECVLGFRTHTETSPNIRAIVRTSKAHKTIFKTRLAAERRRAIESAREQVSRPAVRVFGPEALSFGD